MAMTKDQLISDIAEAIDTPKSTVRAALEQLSEIVSDALETVMRLPCLVLASSK
jgi:DNA-binding protein HU-beta